MVDKMASSLCCRSDMAAEFEAADDKVDVFHLKLIFEVSGLILSAICRLV